MTKYVCVTGGVVSSLGKGIAADSLAAILESRGIRVTNIKLDPYINVDPGTMSPFQHGEVFVTDDGAETDLDLGHNNVCYIHLTLVPYIASAGEIKTKPSQHSVKELREIGIQADALLCRTIQPLPEDERRKIALFTNVQKEAVISAWDVDSIYKIPMMLHEQMLDEIVCHKLNILARAADLSSWVKLVHAQEHPEHEVDIAFVGKYVDLQDSYK